MRLEHRAQALFKCGAAEWDLPGDEKDDIPGHERKDRIDVAERGRFVSVLDQLADGLCVCVHDNPPVISGIRPKRPWPGRFTKE